MDGKELAENIADMLWSASDKQASLSAVESLLTQALDEAKMNQWATDIDGIKKQLVATQKYAYERAAQVAETWMKGGNSPSEYTEGKRDCAVEIASHIRKLGKGGE